MSLDQSVSYAQILESVNKLTLITLGSQLLTLDSLLSVEVKFQIVLPAKVFDVLHSINYQLPTCVSLMHLLSYSLFQFLSELPLQWV